MSYALVVSEYDVGQADGRRDDGTFSSDPIAGGKQSATGIDRNEDGYVEGYIDRQADEQQVNFGQFSRGSTWLTCWFEFPGDTSGSAS